MKSISKAEKRLQFRRALLGLGVTALELDMHLPTPKAKRPAEEAPVARGREVIRFTLLEKEAKEVSKAEKRFVQLPMEQQVELVAAEYNSGKPIRDISGKLGISVQALYDRIERAVKQGKITEMRHNRTTSVEDTQGITLEDFIEVVEKASKEAEILAKRAERLQQAGAIAQALAELLGDDAGELLGQLYEKVSA